MKASSRIAINTAASYSRSILGVGLALFSSRWILQALGAADFGLFNIVGSLIIFLTFFNSVMASSAARHFAFAIGKGDHQDVNRWFNTSLTIHLTLPAILIVIGWPIAEYAICNWLTIPHERVHACVIVFRISLIGAFFNMAAIPFVAMFTAKQRIAEVSMWSTLQHLLIFILAYLLLLAPSDRLIVYATGMVAIHVGIHLAQSIRALFLFDECRINVAEGFDIHRLKELAGFALWTLIGRSGGILRNQGSSILVNLYFGPVENAAYGLANQISTQTTNLSSALTSAVSPEITLREGRGQRDSMISLSARVSKYGTLLALLFAVPFVLEAHYLLRLWLVIPPPHAAILSQFMILTFIADKMTIGYMFSVNAHGKIAVYQATIGGLLLLTLPLVWLFFALGLPPASLGFAFLAIQTICAIGRVLWVKMLFQIPVSRWLSNVLLPCALVALIAATAALSPRCLLQASLWRLLAVCVLSTSATLLAGWFVGLTAFERSHLLSLVSSAISKLKAKKNKKFLEL